MLNDFIAKQIYDQDRAEMEKQLQREWKAVTEQEHGREGGLTGREKTEAWTAAGQAFAFAALFTAIKRWFVG